MILGHFVSSDILFLSLMFYFFGILVCGFVLQGLVEESRDDFLV